MVAKALRDAGMEVVFIGNQMPEGIVAVAAQEDVDVIGLSSLSGNHKVFMPKLLALLKENGMDDIPVIIGGVVPEKDREALLEAGVLHIFGPGDSLQEVVGCVRSAVLGEKGPFQPTPRKKESQES